MSKFPMTLQGAARLREELEHLKQKVRPRISSEIAMAREYGDLRENAEYKAAREAQSFCEGRIKELEHKLALAHLIDVSSLPKTDRVVFGTTIGLFKESTEETLHYQIVGDEETDLKASPQRISVYSPLARSLIGKQKGEVVNVETPSGQEIYQILEVCYQS